MFWMIHSSDHERAIPLMEGAYSGVGLTMPDGSVEQLEMLSLCVVTPPAFAHILRRRGATTCLDLSWGVLTQIKVVASSRPPFASGSRKR